MKKLKVLASAALVVCALLSGVDAPARATDHFDPKVHCDATDPQGRRIPTRLGNSRWGWRHFSGPHRIKKCAIVDAAIRGKADRQRGARLEYWADAVGGRTRHVRIVVVVQYSRRTADREYDVGEGKRIGVITAYCRGMRKCPDWLNR